jgi:hypothetical protein
MLGNMGPRKIGYGRISKRCISNCITNRNHFFLSYTFFQKKPYRLTPAQQLTSRKLSLYPKF